MPSKVPTPAHPVNPAAPWRSSLIVQQAAIWLPLGGAALVAYWVGLDNWLALSLYQPDLQTFWGGSAWALRQWGAAIPGYIALAALLALFWPKLWQTRPLLYKACAVMALTAILGAGLINQVVVQDVADRLRPRDSLLATSPITTTELKGNSMPSGHAGMAFVLAAPFFVLRRQRPKLAKAILAGGLGAGAVVGGARMILGAHFFSDILVAAAISLSAASLLAMGLGRWPRIPRRWIVAVMVVGAIGTMLGNRFTLTLVQELNEPIPNLNLPCVVNRVADSVSKPMLTVTVKGYGAPASGGNAWAGLYLQNAGGTLTLAQGLGLYHSLTCTATLTTSQNDE